MAIDRHRRPRRYIACLSERLRYQPFSWPFITLLFRSFSPIYNIHYLTLCRRTLLIASGTHRFETSTKVMVTRFHQSPCRHQTEIKLSLVSGTVGLKGGGTTSPEDFKMRAIFYAYLVLSCRWLRRRRCKLIVHIRLYFGSPISHVLSIATALAADSVRWNLSTWKLKYPPPPPVVRARAHTHTHTHMFVLQ